MYFVRIWLSFLILQLAKCIDMELFMDSSRQTESNIGCCFDRFEELFRQRKINQRSAVILLPDSSDNSQVENVFVKNSGRKNPWLLQIWYSKMFPNIPELFPENLLSVLVQIKDDSNSSSKICVVKFSRNGFRPEELCSLINIPNASDAVVSQKSKKSLHAAAIATFPFTYYDASSGNLKGFDVSLIETLAAKLELPFYVNLIGGKKSDSLTVQSVFELLADK